MKALVKIKREPNAVELKEEMELPKVGPDEALVEVKAAGICGTDLHVYDWTPWAAKAGLKIPLIPGHEFAGRVVETGSEVKNFSIGDRVAVEPHVPCGRCFQCATGRMHICQNYKIFGLHMDGAFAEYALVPSVCLYRLPQKASYEEGATFEPAGMAVHAVEKAQLSPGEIVAILGCGPIGLFAIQVARASGALMVIATDVNEYRLELADKVGADVSLNPGEKNFLERVGELTRDKGGVDVVIEASGAPMAMSQGLDILRKAGRMIIIGLPSKSVGIDVSSKVVFKELTLSGVHGRTLWGTWRRTTDLLIAGRIDVKPIVTHKLPLNEFQRGFKLVREAKAGKVLFTL